MEEVTYYEDDAVAEKYAEIGRRGLSEHERVVVDEYFTGCDGRVLDLGCGSGRTTAPLAERGFDVVGVDVCDRMIEVARDVHPDREFRVGDATALSFSDESFDHVLFAGRGIDDIRPAAARIRALLEAWRVLKPGGTFAFDANNQFSRFLFDPTELSGWTTTGRFVSRNLRDGSLLSRYALVEFSNGIDRVHAIVPRAQRRQLADIGFQVEAVVPSNDGRPASLDPRPYYVARKPRGSPDV